MQWRTWVIASLAALAGAQKCSVIEENTDYIGNDIKITSQSTAEACCTDCSKTSGCTVYVWSDGRCILKSTPANKAFYPGARAAKLLLPTGTCSSIQENTDLPGNDIDDPLVLESVDLCCSACAKTDGCLAYVWVLRNNVGTCLLKSSKGTPSIYPGARASYLLPPSPNPTPSPTPAPTPSNNKCAPIQENTDYPGYDLGEPLELPTIDLCCTACSNSKKCAVFVWVLRDGVGTCLLKSFKGQPYPYPGARASYPVAPTPGPAPSKCTPIEYNVDYVGNDLTSTFRTNYADCCSDCQKTFGCSAYVWSENQCWLKTKRGNIAPSPGARAAVLPIAPPNTPLSKVTSGSVSNLLSTISFDYIKGGQWIDQALLEVVNSQVETFIKENEANNFSHASAPVPMFTLEAALGLMAYINVTSAGECAQLTSAFKMYFFTYVPNQQLCLVHENTVDVTQVMLSGSGQSVAFPQLLDDAFISTTIPNLATSDACVKECKDKGTCAGIVYSTGDKTCNLFQPRPTSVQDVVAGWVNRRVSIAEVGSIQYGKMTMAALPKAYVKETVLTAKTLNACATAASQRKVTLFGFTSSTEVCVTYVSSTSNSKMISLPNTALAPVTLSGAFGTDVSSIPATASSSTECYKQCIPSQNACFASVYDSTTKSCALYKPMTTAGSILGWVITTSLPATMTQVNQVDLYVTAHQDDHELFMSAPVYNSIKSSTTKTVFVYLSAGDAGQTDGWWKAREAGTIAATKTWVNMFGLYSSASRSETVLLQGHKIQKVSVGNAVHYFLRLSEASLDSVIFASKKQSPMDQPTESYANAQAIKDVLKAILLAEATKVKQVSASYSKFVDDEGIDHVLHVASGKLTAEMLNAEPRFSSCVSQLPYYGYQKWLDLVNMKESEAAAQRAVWLNLGVGILTMYPRNVWSDHSEALGRTYTGKLIQKTTPCSF